MRSAISTAAKKKLSLFAIFTVLPCLFLYSCIIYSGTGVNGGSVLALALMWVPGLAAIVTKLTIDHTVRGMAGASIVPACTAFLPRICFRSACA